MNHPLPLFARLVLGSGCLISVTLSVVSRPVPKPLKSSASLARGLVWRVEGARAPVYLVGSFHLLREKDLPYPVTVEQAYTNCAQVWFEIPPDQMEKPEVIGKMMAAAALPADQTLQDVISPKTFRRLQQWDGDPTMKLLMSRMRPWMAALTITMIEYQKMGADARFGVEKTYQEKAKQDGKTTGGLETVDLQLGLFTNFTPKQQEEMLSQAFDELIESKKKISELIKAWRLGDDEKLAQLLDDGFKQHPELRKLLLTSRNQEWIEQIEQLLNGDQATMVIVGAGHLCGEESVVDLLQKKRWKVTRVEP